MKKKCLPYLNKILILEKYSYNISQNTFFCTQVFFRCVTKNIIKVEYQVKNVPSITQSIILRLSQPPERLTLK